MNLKFWTWGRKPAESVGTTASATIVMTLTSNSIWEMDRMGVLSRRCKTCGSYSDHTATLCPNLHEL